MELIEAIKAKRLISFVYKGGSKSSVKRKAEVYCLGVSASGDLIVRCWEKPKGWKLFKVELMSQVKLLDESFLSLRSGYNRNGDKSMAEVLEQI